MTNKPSNVSREALNASVVKIMLTYSRDIEKMGDTVGANDTALANKLYSASAHLKEYAHRWVSEPPRHD